MSRINHCWNLFGITANLVLALGIQRNAHLDPKASGVDQVELELQKRVFWCAYNLNVYLSAALGRPMTFHDDDIDQVCWEYSRWLYACYLHHIYCICVLCKC